MRNTSGCSSDAGPRDCQPAVAVLIVEYRHRVAVSALFAAAWVAVNAAADPLPANPAPLNQLNNQSAQALRQMQQPKSLYPPGALQPPSPAQATVRQGLDLQQQTEQRLLQERQRQEFIWRNRKPAAIPGPGIRPGLDAMNQQWQFQLQQQRQLDLFRMQQGWPR